uniref:RING-type E3 ubiquitin transferase n=1 Tax=Araucaria cunninghamii TaxID=56994 RepID=A0A0D6QR34_ARACU
MALPSNHWLLRKRRASRGSVFTPAVNISAVSLMQALTALSQQVICCEKPRVCQRRNAASITRKVKVLSILFEEIRELGIPLPLSALKCFRDLYFILQRTKYLLEDCGVDGSRVWLVVQTEEISRQFHVLTHDMASALDVIPFSLLDATDEFREQVELLHNQAKRSKVFVDKNEEQLCRDVIAVLDEFENEVIPEESRLRRILERLNFENAMDCRREIELLEDEMRTQNELGSEQNVSIINGLIGFMRYCKCVLFGVTEMDADSQFHPSNKSQSFTTDSEDAPVIPDDFNCPISLDLMREPVIVSTGQTYDLASITRWIKEGHSTCPKSGQKLLHTNLTPNFALKSLIIQYCAEHNIPFEESEKKKKNSLLESVTSTKAALEAAKMTAAFLVENLRTGSFEVKKQVAYELRVFAKCGMDNRACIAEAGAIPLLIPLLSSEDPKAQENAVTALLNLSIYESNKHRIVESGALWPIISVLKSGHIMEARENAAASLFSLSSIHEYKKLIGETWEAIPALVDLLRDGTARGKRDAANALFSLLVFPGTDSQVVAAGAVPLLVKLLTDERPGIADDAITVLAALARKLEGLNVLCENPPIPQFVGLLRSGSSSPKCKENSAAILLALCCNGGDEIVNRLVRLPSLISSLYTLTTSGTQRAKSKANSLLRILQTWEPSRTVQNILSSEAENRVTSMR